ncbi:Heterogeneous nuclear ribonucleoprotein 1 [Cocos nucifera]|uniref:Heterogeneous nuclear ribonucleoprotein 1 n=1 Tax=Cocos nucifera TaxID=13894 RepID=A0A8K0MZR5_COCNU|nr:Heterogeneous nuclear ribonucleoprotein 1 [Cocos nucifera]
MGVPGVKNGSLFLIPQIVHIKLKEKGLNETDAVNPSRDLPPFTYTRGETRGFLFDEDELREMEDEETVEMSTTERGLAEAIWKDDGVELVSLAKTICEKALAKADPNADNVRDEETLNPSYAARLLHLACKLDSVECARVLIEGDTGAAVRINEMDGFGRTPLQNAAEMHSAKCIELLLRKNARTDLRSRDESSCLPLEIALSSKRMQVDWSPSDSIEELLTLLRERDFTAIRLLVERTRGVAEIAYANAMAGRVTALAVLLLVAADKFTAPVTVRGEGGFSGKSSRTVYDSVLGEALTLGTRTKAASSGRRLDGNRLLDGWESTQSCREKRKALLREIELLHVFGAVPRSSSNDEKAVAPLLRACQAGDETVIKLLLKENPDVNETDLDGNSSLHWCLRVGSSSRDPRIVWLLLKHGARVSHRNKLGLTPVHVAAGKGNYQALQKILLLHAPECVDLASETKETPLFFAVKNGFIDCAQILLRFGANSQALNLRRQRPIDMAKSQDMRFILSPTSRGFHEFVLNEEAYEEVRDEAAVTERPNSSHSQPKTGICRYFESQGGCVRGARCYYAHGKGELKGVMGCSLELKQAPFNFVTKLPKDFRRKVFIGGLPPSVDSDYLKEFFAAEFGPVEEAVVIGMQAGDRVQSRGFGFVTFKQEATVAAALETHFVTIFGKKVEIKGAVAKTTIPKESSKIPSLQPQLLQDTRNTKSASWAEGQLYSTLKTDAADEQMPKPDGQLSLQNLPPWLSKFRKWLPVFLEEACKRLGEGEWYPLSSLKGDFRATCGMELDHASLGFLKLSDFMRALPGICRMRVVPVGSGPATHMVLLPSLSRPHHEQLSPLSRHKQPLLVTDIQVSTEVHHLPLNPDELPNSPSISELSEDASWLAQSQPLEKDCIDSTGSDERGANISGRDIFEPGFLRPGYTHSSNVEYMIQRSAGHGGTGGWIPPIQLPNLLPGSSDPPFTTYFQRQWDHGLVRMPLPKRTS